MAHDPRDDLTTAQVARMLGVSTTTVLAYVDKGVLTPYRRLPSGHRRYLRADVEALVAQGTAA